MRMSIKKFALGVAGSLAIMLGMPLTSLAASNTVVTPDSTQGWSTADTRTGGAVNFINDATAPAGSGALQLTTDGTTTSKAQYLHAANTPLSSVTSLSYYTKQNAPSGTVADASYQLVLCLTGVTSNTSSNCSPGLTGTPNPTSFATLVYEPYQGGQGTVANNTWQQWKIDSTGLFWSTRTVVCSNGTITGSPGGPAAYTLTQIQTACPDAVAVGYGVNIGTNNPGYDVETDLFNFNGATYDFELHVGPPLHKSQCKNDGYKDFNTPTTFKSESECLRYVRQHNFKIKGDVKYTAYGLQRHAFFQMNRGDNQGIFKYSDSNKKNTYTVQVSDVSMSGNTGYFAGVVTKASNPSWVGQWLFGKVQDDSNPSSSDNPDLIWGSFTDQATAESGVANMSSPADGPFSVTHGNLVVAPTNTP
jgi:hypothetical protein